MYSRTRLWLCAALICASAATPALADECSLSIDANDMMQYNRSQLTAPASCKQVQITLHHVGKEPVNVMGHNWVLTRSKDAAAVAAAGIAAGQQRNYLPANDTRIIAASTLVGGGQSAVLKFDTAALKPGENYQFFCSAPGHIAIMKGRFLLK